MCLYILVVVSLFFFRTDCCFGLSRFVVDYFVSCFAKSRLFAGSQSRLFADAAAADSQATSHIF